MVKPKKKEKKTTTKQAKKKQVSKGKKGKTQLKKDVITQEDTGIIIVEGDAEADKETELEERRAYLEEARSQEASED